MNVEKLKKDITKLVMSGFDRVEIVARLKGSDHYSKVAVPVLTSEVDRFLTDFPNYNTIQLITSGTLVRDVEEDRLVLYNPTNHIKREIASAPLRSLFTPAALKELTARIIVARFDYLPFDHRVLIQETNDIPIFNTYEPPFWFREAFYAGNEELVPFRADLPEVYDRFFKHLVGDDEPSYEYMLDWLSNALHSRNLCYLVMLGEQGIGKGRFGDILAGLFGTSNYAKDIGLRIADKFNAHIANKRIVNIDEFKIESTSQEEKVKDLVNENIPIEIKGRDVKMMRNHASFFFSSNSIDSIKLSTTDRRFSILATTEVQAKDAFSMEFLANLTADENIEQLAHFLYHRKYDAKKMLHVFKSVKTEIVVDTSLNEWQEYFIHTFCWEHAGETMTIKDAIDKVMLRFGEVRWRIGRPGLEELRSRFSYLFRITKKQISPDQPRTWVITIADKQVQLDQDNQLEKYRKKG